VVTPLATSIAAFVGRAPAGPVDEALTVRSFGQFCLLYGGLSFHHPLTHAVQDFFENGGSQAVIARLFEPASASGTGYAELQFPPAAQASLATNDPNLAPSLRLMAANPGAWGNRLSARADVDGTADCSADQFRQYGLAKEDLFNLTLTLTDADGKQIAQERLLNLSVKWAGPAKDFPNRLDLALTHSKLCRVPKLPALPPAPGSVTGSGGDDGDYLASETYIGDPLKKTGLHLLNTVSMFNLLCIPPDRRIFDDVPLPLQDVDKLVRQAAATYCTDRRAIYIVDPPAAWDRLASEGRIADIKLDDLGITGENATGIEVGRNAAVYFPRFIGEDVLMKGRPATFAPSGAIAGVIAATDAARPVVGTVVWGARTLRGADQFEDDYKYLPVRRLILFIEDSLYRATQWAVFEPNDESLWSSLRLSVNDFLAGLAKQGAFYNYSVACDASTTTPTDIANGIVNILIGIAPVKPAEFVMIQIEQTAAISAS
jgi:hypothetical protein